MRRFILLLLSCMGALQAAGSFASADVQRVREIADKFKKPLAADRNEFLTKCGALVAAFKDATPQERASVIESMEYARFGGLMDEITADLKVLIATANATAAGASSPGGTSAGQSTSVTNASTGYLDRIKALEQLINTFGSKAITSITDAEKDRVTTLFTQLYNDRGDAFKEEIALIPELLDAAHSLVYGGNKPLPESLAGMKKNLAVPVDFATNLEAQKKLYSFVGTLSKDQSARIMRKIKEMAQLSTTVTDAVQLEDFKSLLKHIDFKFFGSEANLRAELRSTLNSLNQQDPLFLKSYAEILVSLRGMALTLFTSEEINAFMEKVKKTIDMRYGNKPADQAARSTNASALSDFLSLLVDLPPFAAHAPQITVWNSLVKSDGATVTTAQNFIDKIAAISSVDLIVGAKDAQKRTDFMVQVKSLMDSRYGQTDTDKKNISETRKRLLQFLKWIAIIDWFKSSTQDLNQINIYIQAVTKDIESGQTTPISGTLAQQAPASSTTQSSTEATVSGAFNVSFKEDLEAQITKLEQALPVASNANNKELFILSLYDAVQRHSTSTTVHVNRMKALASSLATASNFGSAYEDFGSFLSGFLNNSIDTAVRNRAFLDFVVRVAAMNNSAQQVQQQFIELAHVLLRSYPASVSADQASALNQAVQSVLSRSVFTGANNNLLNELSAELQRKMVNAGVDVSSTSSQITTATTNQTSSSQVPTNQQPNPAVTTTPATPVAISTPSATQVQAAAPQLTAAQITELQRQAARAYASSRARNWN